MSRRLRLSLVWTVSVVAVLAVGSVFAFHVLVGKPAYAPEQVDVLSPGARALIESAVADFRVDPAFDHHVHVVGLGAGGTGCRANPKFLSWWHPKERIQFLAYQRSTGVTDLDHTDEQVAARLVSLARNVGVSCFGILAFDAHYGPDGVVHEDETEFYVPNTHVERLARDNPTLFEAIASVHPYRPDAVAELERCAAQGARIVKWLPNAMGMDPADPRCDAFYAAMARLKLTLLTHAGTEHAVESAASQEFGNPLRLRRALDAGVRVFVAHCASLGQGLDLDDPAQPNVDNFDLFLRLMDDPRYLGRVFGEISALPQVNRAGRYLETMLARTDLHERLVSGSDYPLPCIDVLFQTGKLAREGYITDDEAAQLDEIWDVNPLLFDFVLKRALKHPQTGVKFPASVFRRR